MSKYGWERGTIKIPSKEWKRFKDSLAAAWNKRMAELENRAQRAYEDLKANKLNTRSQYERDWEYRPAWRRDLTDDDAWWILGSVYGGKDGRLVKPKKKDFPAVNTATRVYDFSEGVIDLNFKENTVTWDVPENNHAVEHAREHWMGRVFFGALDAISSRNGWSSRSGGTIIGNDEYNRDDRDFGGGANYETANYGKASNRENQRRLSHSRYAYECIGHGVRW